MKKEVLNYIMITGLIVSAAFTSCSNSSKIKITTIHDDVTISLYGSGSATIDWGDRRMGKESMTLNEKGELFSQSYDRYSPKKRSITINCENITGLFCDNITSLDVSRCTELTSLTCVNGSLTSLDLSNNTALTNFGCINSGSLTSLDVSKNTMLTWLDCSSCYELTSLDVSKNTMLTWLNCSYCWQLKSLDVSNNITLQSLDVMGCRLSTLDVSKNIVLTSLDCSNSALTSLDVSNNTTLTDLTCTACNLTSLDVSKNAALINLGIERNRFTTVALNSLFETLYDKPLYRMNILGKPEIKQKQIYITDNSGTAACDKSIAEKNGWRVIIQ